jgi:hypothetical protein
MAAKPVRRAPSGLGRAGRALWSDVVADFELSSHEEALLLQAARTADAIDRLEAVVAAEGDVLDVPPTPKRVHPALVEARQQRIALARLVACLAIPADDEKPRRSSRPARGVYSLRSSGRSA